MEVFDFHRELRATIDEEGAVKNAKGGVLGFINQDGACGDVNESFLGEINQDGQAIDPNDEVIGKCELDHGTLRDASGSHWATIYPGGDINDGEESYRGKIDNFSFHKLKIVAAYIYFFDQALIKEGRPTKVLEEGASHVSSSSASSSAAPTASANPWGEEVTQDLPPPVRNTAAASKPAVVEEHSTISLAPPSKPAGPVVHEQHETISLSAPAPVAAPPPKVFKPYRVGEFQGIENGTKNKLEIFSCDCSPAQMSVRIEQNGQNIVFKRGEQQQRFALPYQVTVERVSAVYDAAKEDGTLTLIMTKPTVASSGAPISGKFFNFTVPATSGEGKVNMSAGQTSSYFLFKPQGSSKYSTDIEGELVSGRDVKFHATVTQTDKGTKTTSTQTFTVPYQIAMDHIQVTGDEVKVFIKHPGGAVTITVQDADVPIKTA